MSFFENVFLLVIGTMLTLISGLLAWAGSQLLQNSEQIQLNTTAINRIMDRLDQLEDDVYAR